MIVNQPVTSDFGEADNIIISFVFKYINIAIRERVEYQEVKAKLGFEMRTKTKTKNYQKIKKKARGGRRSNYGHNYLVTGKKENT